MKVLNVNSLLSVKIGGGTAQRTRQMSRYLVEAGIECSVVTNNAELDKDTLNNLSKVDVLALSYLTKRFYISMPFSLKLFRMFKEASVVHIMGHWTPINALAYLIVRFYNKPYVVCPAGALPLFGRSKTFKHIYNLLVGRAIIKNADKCIAVTQDETSDFLEYGVPPESVAVIPNGIDIEQIDSSNELVFRQKYGLVDKPYILFVGRLNAIKGIDLLIEAVCSLSKQDLRNYHFLIAGADEGLLGSLMEKVTDFGLEDRVHFCGFLMGEEKQQAFLFAELLVIPSRKEAMSIVLLEAGIAGTPVLITNRCGFNELSNADCGWVCDATIEGISRGLRCFFDSDLKKQYGQNLKALVHKNYGWPHIINSYLSLYGSIQARQDQISAIK